MAQVSGWRAVLGGPGRRRAKAYLTGSGLSSLLTAGEENEIGPDLYDLYNIHRMIRRRRPTVCLEFGVGFSTLAIAHALRMNRESGAPEGVLHSVDTSAEWIDNTDRKLSPALRDAVRFHRADAFACLIDGELCHRFDRLPDIVPQFILLDGPDPRTVRGSVNGLSFSGPGPYGRSACSADPLLYEASLSRGFILLVDGRRKNVRFLRRNLKRRYRHRRNHVHHYDTLELVI